MTKQSTATREINKILQFAAWAMRTSPNMMGINPIKTQSAADTRQQSGNRSRTNYKYVIGDKVRIIATTRERRGKLFGFKHEGPYSITAFHNNGTVAIKCGNFHERINIRRLKRVKTKGDSK